nr:MAG TPA: hypothetical protein [Crassvirales sp.]
MILQIYLKIQQLVRLLFLLLIIRNLALYQLLLLIR